MPTPLRLLWIAGADDDLISLHHELQDHGFEVEGLRVADLAAARRALAEPTWEAVICSVRGTELPAALDAIDADGGDSFPPLIVVADHYEDVGLMALRRGAHVCLRGRTPPQLPAAIERSRRDVTIRREQGRERAFELGQRELLERTAAGAPLDELLQGVVLLVEAQSDDMVCSILRVDRVEGKLRHAATSSLPATFVRAIDGLSIGPAVGSCGTAAYRGERVIVEDIAHHESWAPFRDHALACELRACWSSPIFSPERDVLGTFAMYYRTPRGPNEREVAWVERATHLAAIALVRDRDEHVLRCSEARYRQLIDTAYEGVWLTDALGRTLFVNGRSCELLGYTAEELVGHNLLDFLDAESHPLAQALVERTPKASQQVELSFRRKDGSQFWAIVSASATRGKRGEVTGLLTLLTDITEHKRAERAFRQSQRIESLITLAGGIAHDFNNILMAISGNMSIASSDLPADHPVQDALREIDVACVRAADLVRRVLTFSRKQEFRPQPVRFDTIAERALTLLRAKLPESIRIDARYAPGLPEVLGDAGQLQELVTNLATNAVDSMHESGGVLAMRVTSLNTTAPWSVGAKQLPAGAYLKLELDDSGTGMDAATVERIFDPFFTTKLPGQGTGLGLSVVHGIVQSHGGAVDVRSSPRHGSSFTVFLPAHQPRPRTSRSMASRGEGERVLCLDDEESVSRVTAQMLRRLGYRTVAHVDAWVALREFQANPNDIDVVLTDFAMPQLTCIELVRAIRLVRPSLPIVVTSGRIDAEDIEALQKLGVREVVWKPSTVAELSAALRRALRARGEA